MMATLAFNELMKTRHFDPKQTCQIFLRQYIPTIPLIPQILQNSCS